MAGAAIGSDTTLAEAVTGLLDRRCFIAGAGNLTFVSLLPLPAVAAARGASAAEWLADWTIDDMWGIYPRYAESIGYGRSSGTAPAIAAEPADVNWIEFG